MRGTAIKLAGWLLATACFLGGCMPTELELRLERDLETLKLDSAALRREIAEQQQSASKLQRGQEVQTMERLDVLTRKLADLQAETEALRVEQQTLNGRLDDITSQRKEISGSLSIVQRELAGKVSTLETRLEQLQKRLEEPPVAPPVTAASTPEAAYEKSLGQIKAGDFSSGRSGLEAFLAEHPEHALAPNASYWIGEAYYGEKQYENAIVNFQDVIQKYPQHTKAPAAMFKQAMSFYVLGDKKNARVVLRNLLETYPKAEEAKKAKERLAEWDKKN